LFDEYSQHSDGSIFGVLMNKMCLHGEANAFPGVLRRGMKMNLEQIVRLSTVSDSSAHTVTFSASQSKIVGRISILEGGVAFGVKFEIETTPGDPSFSRNDIDGGLVITGTAGVVPRAVDETPPIGTPLREGVVVEGTDTSAKKGCLAQGILAHIAGRVGVG